MKRGRFYRHHIILCIHIHPWSAHDPVAVAKSPRSGVLRSHAVRAAGSDCPTTHVCALSRERDLRAWRDRWLDRDPGSNGTDLPIQVDDSPQQFGSAQRRQAGSLDRESHDRNRGGSARDDLRRGRGLRRWEPGSNAAAECGSFALHWRQHRAEHGVLCRRRGGVATEDRIIHASSSRLRCVLGKQARRSGQGSDQCGADTGRDRMCRAWS